MFDKTKQKTKEEIEKFRSELELMGYHLTPATMVLENSLLAVLGDLQVEAQKTWKELFESRPRLTDEKYTKMMGLFRYKALECFADDTRKYWEKAGKLLETTK